MSIPVHLGAAVVFDDRIDLFARAADGVPVTLRLSRAAALSLAGRLRRVEDGEWHSLCDIPAILDHPYALPVREVMS